MIVLLFVIIVIGIILEVASLRRDIYKVEIDSTITPQCVEPGTPFQVHTTLTNKSRLPISYLAIKKVFPLVAQLPESMERVAMIDGLHAEVVCRISGRSRKKLMYEASIEKRGVHPFSVYAIEFGDFLGFSEISKEVYHRQEIVVYPKRLKSAELADTLGSFCGDIAAKRFLIRDPVLTTGVREYTGREPMKEIHWSKSANRGELMVREFEYCRQLSVCVVLSVEGINYDEMDRCCEAVRTICESLVEKGVSVSFFTNARLRGKEHKGVWKCEVSCGRSGGLLEGLGRATIHSCGSFDGMLEFVRHESSHDVAYIIVLPAGEKRGDEAADRLRSSTGQEVVLIRMASAVQKVTGENI